MTTTTLDKINGESLSVPGLRFWGHRSPHFPGRFAIVASNERGAVELWAEQTGQRVQAITGDSSYGGIEIHSPRPLCDGQDPVSNECEISLGAGLGGTCWTDGSSLVYVEGVLPLLRAGDSQGVLRLLADWHASHFPA